MLPHAAEPRGSGKSRFPARRIRATISAISPTSVRVTRKLKLWTQNPVEDPDSWKAYLKAWEKADHALWKVFGDITSLTTFVLSLTFILVGVQEFLRRTATIASGTDAPPGAFHDIASRAFMPVAVGLVFSIVVNLYATRHCGRLEAAGAKRKREHDEIVHVTRAMVRLGRLAPAVPLPARGRS